MIKTLCTVLKSLAEIFCMEEDDQSKRRRLLEEFRLKKEGVKIVKKSSVVLVDHAPAKPTTRLKSTLPVPSVKKIIKVPEKSSIPVKGMNYFWRG